MTDRPIIFSAPMVQALLAGRKTMTRRVLKEQRHVATPRLFGGRWQWFGASGAVLGDVRLPYAPGDRLWVREALGFWPGHAEYDADGEFVCAPDEAASQWVENYARARAPSIHMPRWASRLTLHVTEVRVRRLQEISEADARAEGAKAVGAELAPPDAEDIRSYVWGFHDLWNSLHGADAWDANPWVAAISFEVERANIEQARSAHA